MYINGLLVREGTGRIKGKHKGGVVSDCPDSLANPDFKGLLSRETGSNQVDLIVSIRSTASQIEPRLPLRRGASN